MALAAPRLCCLDLDTFFVSVERVLDPTLVGKPVVVGGMPGQRGVVTAASYEVRALGVKSGMSLTEAFKLAPNAVYLPTRHGVYGEYSERVRRIAENYTPVSQIASIDEMFLDFSGCENLYHIPEDATPDATIERTVRRLTDEIQSRVGLPASAGIATSRSVAKVASGVAKPRGVRLVPAGQTQPAGVTVPPAQAMLWRGTPPAAVLSPTAPADPSEQCGVAGDDDGDGFVDCADAECAGNVACGVLRCAAVACARWR